MGPKERTFAETSLYATPIRDLGIAIAGTALEPIVAQVTGELQRAGIRQLKPRFYLSTEWGVPFDTVSVGIPFYLARPDLTAIQDEEAGLVEGKSPAEILRYLRHELGHVVNYGYRLYDDQDWVRHFGSITQPYVEDFRPVPFSRRYVRHLPGWYAQKHPDEDWAETFAVWLSPELDWRTEYADRPEALGKLSYCDRTMERLGDQEPLVTADERDEDVAEVADSIQQYYGKIASGTVEFPRGVDGALRAIFEELGEPDRASQDVPLKPASSLIARIERDMITNAYRWTGHFPERTRVLVRHLAARADELHLGYTEGQENAAIVALTTLVAALAMNHVHRGTYIP
jgi:hypothetical protein